MINTNDLQGANPPLALELSNEEIKSCIDNNVKPDIPDLPSHAQSVERSVKLVSEASRTSYGFESRHKTIVAKILSRNMRPSFSSKGHYQQCYEELEQL